MEPRVNLNFLQLINGNRIFMINSSLCPSLGRLYLSLVPIFLSAWSKRESSLVKNKGHLISKIEKSSSIAIFPLEHILMFEIMRRKITRLYQKKLWYSFLIQMRESICEKADIIVRSILLWPCIFFVFCCRRKWDTRASSYTMRQLGELLEKIHEKSKKPYKWVSYVSS